jgi:hypothetical protein
VRTFKDGREVYHAEWMESMPDFLWCDKETMEWAHMTHPFTQMFTGIKECLHQAKRLDIFTRLIIIDGQPDAGGDTMADEHSLRIPAAPVVAQPPKEKVT